MARKILVYGHPDDRPELGFPDEDSVRQYIRDGIFSAEHSRYRYSQDKDADVIVLSRFGLAYGHFEIEEKVEPTDDDRVQYPPVKCVYIVRSSALYRELVRLSTLGIRGIQFGKYLTEEEFEEVQNRAGAITIYPGSLSE